MNGYFRSMVSLGAVIAFAFLALGSGSVTTVTRNETYDPARDVYVAEYLNVQGEVLETREGQRDWRGRWNGPVRGTYFNEDGYSITEYQGGQRHGWHRQYDEGGRLLGSTYYQNNQVAQPPQSPQMRAALIDMALSMTDPDTFYRQLGAQRPWFIDGIAGLGSTTELLKSFVDEVESYVLSQSPSNQSQFDTAFDAGMNAAEEIAAYQPVYDSYRDLHSIEILEAGKNDALRLATLDRYEGGLADSTLAILQTSYPQYLEALQAHGATLADMQRVTTELDRRLDALGSLDPNDPEFTILADARLDATLSAMRSDEFDFGTTTSAVYTEFVKMSRAADPVYQAARSAYFGDHERDRSRSDWRVTEIYIATMSYAPDSEGLDYWVAEIAAKPATWNPTTVAQSFFDQPLVQALYPAGQDPGLFVDALYRNLFGRAPDAAGRAYWLAELRAGRVLRNQMIIALIEGGWDNPDAAVDMARFGNQVEVGLAFAAAQLERGILYSRLNAADQAELRRIGRELIADVTDDDATRTAAIASIPGLLAAVPSYGELLRLEASWPAVAGWENCGQPKSASFQIQGPAYLKQITLEDPYTSLNFMIWDPVGLARYTEQGEPINYSPDIETVYAKVFQGGVEVRNYTEGMSMQRENQWHLTANQMYYFKVSIASPCIRQSGGGQVAQRVLTVFTSAGT